MPCSAALLALLWCRTSVATVVSLSLQNHPSSDHTAHIKFSIDEASDAAVCLWTQYEPAVNASFAGVHAAPVTSATICYEQQAANYSVPANAAGIILYIYKLVL
jgi:hypothetical protein